MSLAYKARYLCDGCGAYHANGSKAQAKCEAERDAIARSHAAKPCSTCRLWPARTDGRCADCGTSPRERGMAFRKASRYCGSKNYHDPHDWASHLVGAPPGGYPRACKGKARLTIPPAAGGGRP